MRSRPATDSEQMNASTSGRPCIRHRVSWALQNGGCGGLGLRVSFDAGEQTRTEISAKFSLDRVRDELSVAGLITVH